MREGGEEGVLYRGENRRKTLEHIRGETVLGGWKYVPRETSGGWDIEDNGGGPD